MEQKVPLEPGEASVRAWAAGVSLCCRPRPCCCAQAGAWGGRWHAAPGEAEEGRRSCASSPHCWWDWAERGPVTRVSASGAALEVRPGCCPCHLEDAHWLWSLEASGQQLGNWGLGGPVYQPGSLQIQQKVPGQQSQAHGGELSPHHPASSVQPAWQQVQFWVLTWFQAQGPLTNTTATSRLHFHLIPQLLLYSTLSLPPCSHSPLSHLYHTPDFQRSHLGSVKNERTWETP